MELTDYYQKKGGGLERHNEYYGPGSFGFMGAESFKKRVLKRLMKRLRHKRKKRKTCAASVVRQKQDRSEMMGFDFGGLLNSVSEAVGSFTKGYQTPGSVSVGPGGIQYQQIAPPPTPVPQKVDYMKYLPIAIPVGLIAITMMKRRG